MSVRDGFSRLAYQQAASVQVLGGDIDRPNFIPIPGALHTAGAAGAHIYTITTASVANYTCEVGSGFQFSVQNNSGNAITFAVSGIVTAGAGTAISVPLITARTRMFQLTRISDQAWQLDSFGILTQ